MNIVAYQETQKKGRGEYGCKSGNTECRVIVEFMPVGKLGNLLLRSGWRTLFTLITSTLFTLLVNIVYTFLTALTVGALHILHNTGYGGGVFPIYDNITFLGQKRYKVRSHTIHFQL